MEKEIESERSMGVPVALLEPAASGVEVVRRSGRRSRDQRALARQQLDLQRAQLLVLSQAIARQHEVVRDLEGPRPDLLRGRALQEKPGCLMMQLRALLGGKQCLGRFPDAIVHEAKALGRRCDQALFAEVEERRFDVFARALAERLESV